MAIFCKVFRFSADRSSDEESTMTKEKTLLFPEVVGRGTAVRVSVGEMPYWGHFRTYRVKNGYLCGVCRNSYADEGDAKNCVSCCVTPFAQSKVDILVRGMKTRFRCPFCYREYLDTTDAVSCLVRCKNHIFSETGCERFKEAVESDMAIIRHRLHQTGSSLPRHAHIVNGTEKPSLSEVAANERNKVTGLIQAPAPQLKVVAPAQNVAVPQKSAPKPGPTLNMQPTKSVVKPAETQAVIPVFTEAVSSAPVVEEPPAIEAAGKAESYDPNMIYREEGQKPFSRDNARYVCTACHQKFFTKTEVEGCFNSHPLKPDV